MLKRRGNFYGILLLLLMFVVVLGLFTSNPQTTGFVVKETKQYKSDIVMSEIKEKNDCVGNIPHVTCSNTQPLYCDDGNLIYNCYECGCNEGQTCGEHGFCNEIQKCADGSIYGECSFLNGKFCQEGKLINYCELCGCKGGYICNDGKCIRQ